MKGAIRTVFREFKNLHLGRKIERFLVLSTSICWAIVVPSFLYVGYQLTQSEGEIDGTLFQRDQIAGTYSIGHVKTKKYAPKFKEHKTMVGISVDYHGIRQYHVKRKLFNPFGMGIWGGVFVQEGQHPQLGNMFGAGISFSTSF